MRNEGGSMPSKILIMRARKSRSLKKRCFKKKTQQHTQQHNTTKRKPTPTHTSEIRESLGFLETFFGAKAFERAFSETMPFPFFVPKIICPFPPCVFLGQGYHVHQPSGDMQFLIPDPDSDCLRSKTSRFLKKA